MAGSGKKYEEYGRAAQQDQYFVDENGIPGQMTLGEMPDHSTDIYNAPERHRIVEQDGSPAEERGLMLNGVGDITDDDLRSGDFFKYLKEQPQQLLDYLLSKQSNTHPLKKGGNGIAYKCEALLLGTRIGMSDHENLLFDMVLATVSSLPENDTYTIYLSDIMRYLPYDDLRYVEKIFKEAKDGLSEQRVKISARNTGIGAELDLPLVGPGIFKGSNEIDVTDKSAFYTFTLEPMTKALMISSGFTHGAYYKVEWSAQLKGYAKRLFFWLESIKNYKAYPDAVPGVMYVDIEQLREMLDIPNSYKDCDIKAKIIDYSLKKINAVEGIDIQADCLVKHAPRSKKTIGYLFTVTQVKEIGKASEQALIESKDGTRYNVEIGILEAYKYSSQEIQEILNAYEANNRNLQFMTQAVTLVESVSTKKDIVNRKEYLCTVMKNGIMTGSMPGRESASNKKNTFNNFQQRAYTQEDYDDFERIFQNPQKKS